MSKRKVENEEKEANQLRVAQQHLANERTYLAWMRTALTIVGIGFLTITLHLTIGESHLVSDQIAVLLSVLSSLFGIGIMITAAVRYARNRKRIQTQEFHSSHWFIIFATVSLVIIVLVAILYLLTQFMHISNL